MVNVAVIFYSATGNVAALASAVAQGAAAAEADVRLRRVHELAPPEAIERNPAWKAYYDRSSASVEEASLADLEWADAIAFGTPSRFGAPAAQLKQFIDQAGGLWAEGRLTDKAVTSFTSAANEHGGHESTILSLANVFYHWGCLLVPPGYTSELVDRAGGNPYGASWTSGDGRAPSDVALQAAEYQGRRLVEVAARLKAGVALALTGMGPSS